MTTRYHLFCILFGIIIIQPCSAQQLDLLSESMFHGSYYEVAISGNYAICTGHNHIFTISFANPANPEMVSISEFSGGTIAAYQQGNLVYFIGDAAGQGSDVYIVDIADPVNPVVVSSFNTRSTAYDILVDGAYAYVADYANQILIANVADPADPFAVARINTPGYAYALAKTGIYLYVAQADSGLAIFDISDPYHPYIAGRSAPDSAGYHTYNDIEIAGNYAYIAENPRGLLIYDISNPLTPSHVSTRSLTNYGFRHVKVRNNLAYCEAGWRYLYVLDVSDPSRPDSIGYYGSPEDNPRNFAIDGSRLFLLGNQTNGQYGYVDQLDISSTSTPTLISSFHGCRVSPYNVAISGDYAFVGSNGLYILDISNPSEPVSVCEFNRIVSDLHVYDNIGFGISDSNAVIFFDISNPENVSFSGYCTIPTSPRYVAESQNYVYVSTYGPGIYVIDARDPGLPEIVQLIIEPNDFGRLACDSGYLYALGASLGIYDISTPETPVQITNFNLPYSSGSIIVSGNYAYIACGSSSHNWIMLVNLTDKQNPSIFSYLELSHGVYAMDIDGNYLYLCEPSNKIEVADVRDPYHPAIIGSFNSTVMGNSLQVRDNTLYYANDLTFQILRFQGPDNIDEATPSVTNDLLLECYPNPSNSNFVLKYSLKAPTDVEINLYDINGRKVGSISRINQQPGEYSATWDCSAYSSGVYFVEMNAGSQKLRQKVTLIK
jgi:hypothetical protein